MGIYKPEFTVIDDIDILEKHTCPELFICCGGRAGLLCGFGADERIIEMNPGEALMVEDYHNGFIIDDDGYFTVVERSNFTTEYIDRSTGKLVKTVSV